MVEAGPLQSGSWKCTTKTPLRHEVRKPADQRSRLREHLTWGGEEMACLRGMDDLPPAAHHVLTMTNLLSGDLR
jgi:hypothetical protein